MRSPLLSQQPSPQSVDSSHLLSQQQHQLHQILLQRERAQQRDRDQILLAQAQLQAQRDREHQLLVQKEREQLHLQQQQQMQQTMQRAGGGPSHLQHLYSQLPQPYTSQGGPPPPPPPPPPQGYLGQQQPSRFFSGQNPGAQQRFELDQQLAQREQHLQLLLDGGAGAGNRGRGDPRARGADGQSAGQGYSIAELRQLQQMTLGASGSPAGGLNRGSHPQPLQQPGGGRNSPASTLHGLSSALPPSSHPSGPLPPPNAAEIQNHLLRQMMLNNGQRAASPNDIPSQQGGIRNLPMNGYPGRTAASPYGNGGAQQQQYLHQLQLQQHQLYAGGGNPGGQAELMGRLMHQAGAAGGGGGGLGRLGSPPV